MLRSEFFTLVITVSICSILAQDCDLERGNSCYKFSTNTASWFAAADSCRTQGGTLVEIEDELEDELIKNKMDTLGRDTMWTGGRETRTDWRWIKDETFIQYQGCFNDSPLDRDLDNQINVPSNEITPSYCNRQCSQAGYKYASVQFLSDGVTILCRCGNSYGKHGQTDGCAVQCQLDKDQYCGGYNKQSVYRLDAPSFNKWYRDQPNNYDPYQECLALVNGNQYRWGDESCSQKHKYICQYDIEFAACQRQGYTFAGSACLSRHNTEITWFWARDDCEKRGGYLMKMSSEELYQEVFRLLDGSGTKWWIGATNRKWTWPSGQEIKYTGWHDRTPDSPQEECLLLKRAPGIQWDDDGCNKEHHFVCEIALGIPTTQKRTTERKTTQKPTTESRTTKISTPRPVTVKVSTKAPTLPPTAEKTQAPVTVRSTSAPEEETTKTNGGGDNSQTVGAVEVLPKGVIVAIVVAGVAVLVAFISLIVYCVRGSRRKYIDSASKAEAQENEYHNPTFENDMKPNETAEIDPQSRPVSNGSDQPPPDVPKSKRKGMDWAY